MLFPHPKMCLWLLTCFVLTPHTKVGESCVIGWPYTDSLMVFLRHL